MPEKFSDRAIHIITLVLPGRESPSIFVPKFNFGTQLGCEVELRNQ